MRVRFIQPWTAYGVGADPILDDVLANQLIGRGLCRPYAEPIAVTEASVESFAEACEAAQEANEQRMAAKPPKRRRTTKAE